ncbi:MAG TPA: hypothetical protein VEZ42_21505, partial [Pseudonocardia sp.]|nr:hypothetical protein [Pseudonocardia sp.]
MSDDRRTAGWLDAELARREDAQARMAATLLELERTPGHRLLSSGAPTGTTGQRWAEAQDALAGLWRDFDAFRTTVRTARDVRDRRPRPGPRELGELHRLLVEPSIEVARTAVALADRGLTGPAEQVDTVTLGDLGDRMKQSFQRVRDIVVAVEAAHSGFLAALVPVAEQLRDARRLAADLAVDEADPEVAAVATLTDRVAALEREVAADPLGLAAGAGAVLAALAAETAAVAGRLAGQAAQRERWDADLAAARAAVGELARLHAEAGRMRQRAAERIAGPQPPLPAGPERFGESLDALARPDGWARRTAGLAALRTAVDATRDELRTAHELAEGLLARREELRGRFGAFRARAARLGH